MRRWRGAIALDAETFVPFCLSWTDARLHEMCQRFVAMKLTHVIVMLSGEYRGTYPWFWLWDNIPEIRRKLEIIKSYNLLTVLWAANGESFRTTQVEEVWRRTLPQIADLLDAAVPAPEMNDIWSPADQHRYTLLLAELLPNTYRVIHFTRGRCHGDHNRGTGPEGEPPSAWNPEPDPNNPGHFRAGVQGYWKATPAHALYYNVPYDHFENLPAFVEDLEDVSVRVNGRVSVPGKSAPYPGMGRDVVYGEGAAEWVLQQRWTYAQGQTLRDQALTVPGITGFGD